MNNTLEKLGKYIPSHPRTCGGRLLLIADIEPPAVIDKILAHLGPETVAVDPPHPSRTPPEPDRLI